MASRPEAQSRARRPHPTRAAFRETQSTNSSSDIRQGGSAAVANEPVNQGPRLIILEKAGPIKLKDGVGFKLVYAVTHETFSDIVAHLVPGGQKRGVYKRDYAPGTLRDKRCGAGPPLPSTNVGAHYRRSSQPSNALDAAE